MALQDYLIFFLVFVVVVVVIVAVFLRVRNNVRPTNLHLYKYNNNFTEQTVRKGLL